MSESNMSWVYIQIDNRKIGHVEFKESTNVAQLRIILVKKFRPLISNTFMEMLFDQGGKGETPVLQYSTVLQVLCLYSTHTPLCSAVLHSYSAVLHCTPLVLHSYSSVLRLYSTRTPLILHPYSGVLESRLFPLVFD